MQIRRPKNHQDILSLIISVFSADSIYIGFNPGPSMPKSFHERAVAAIKSIPSGKVATYGQIAAMAGNPRGARMVSRVLHSSSKKENLPWHRVINREGKISIPRGDGYELQKAKLQDEGVLFNREDQIDLDRFRWEP